MSACAGRRRTLWRRGCRGRRRGRVAAAGREGRHDRHQRREAPCRPTGARTHASPSDDCAARYGTTAVIEKGRPPAIPVHGSGSPALRVRDVQGRHACAINMTVDKVTVTVYIMIRGRRAGPVQHRRAGRPGWRFPPHGPLLRAGRPAAGAARRRPRAPLWPPAPRPPARGEVVAGGRPVARRDSRAAHAPAAGGGPVPGPPQPLRGPPGAGSRSPQASSCTWRKTSGCRRRAGWTNSWSGAAPTSPATRKARTSMSASVTAVGRHTRGSSRSRRRRGSRSITSASRRTSSTPPRASRFASRTGTSRTSRWSDLHLPSR